jgi:hypothetical protein
MFQGVDWIDLRRDLETVAGFCKHDNEPLVFLKCGIHLG